MQIIYFEKNKTKPRTKQVLTFVTVLTEISRCNFLEVKGAHFSTCFIELLDAVRKIISVVRLLLISCTGTYTCICLCACVCVCVCVCVHIITCMIVCFLFGFGFVALFSWSFTAGLFFYFFKFSL